MKIKFVSFQGVNSKNQSWGMTRLLENIIDTKNIENEYYVGITPENYKYFKNVSILLYKLNLIIWSIGIKIKINPGYLRLAQEYLFDIVLKKKIKLPCILISTAYIPKVAQLNREKGGINIFISGNPYEEYIKNILDNESIKYNIKIKNAYTIKSRIDYINKFLIYQDEIICQTNLTYDSYSKFFIDIKKTLIIMNNLPTLSMFPENEVKKNEILTFIYVGQTVWLKGLIYLLEAWKSIYEEKVKLIIVGPIYEDVEKWIKNNFTLRKNIEIIGFVELKNLNKLYRKSHVCIVPSIIDNHPATIGEAMSCGLPVICTTGCGAKNLVTDYYNGFVVQERSVKELADKIIWFIKNREKIKQMSINAHNSINNIFLNHADDEFKNYFDKLLQL